MYFVCVNNLIDTDPKDAGLCSFHSCLVWHVGVLDLMDCAGSRGTLYHSVLCVKLLLATR